MSMLVMCNAAYLKRGNFYWIKFIVSSAMLGIYVKYMILLVVLKTLRNTFPTQCEFSDNGIVCSYAKGVYNYYDVQQIEEFVAFKGL